MRKESWGLLFYSQIIHRLFFIKSEDWLYPRHFDGAWPVEKVIEDIAVRTGKPPEIIEPALVKLLENLVKNGTIEHELC